MINKPPPSKDLNIVRIPIIIPVVMGILKDLNISIPIIIPIKVIFFNHGSGLSQTLSSKPQVSSVPDEGSLTMGSLGSASDM